MLLASKRKKEKLFNNRAIKRWPSVFIKGFEGGCAQFLKLFLKFGVKAPLLPPPYDGRKE